MKTADLKKINNFVIEWFEKNTRVTRDELEKSLEADYLHSGWLDSFQFISFIADAEKEFHINFDNTDFKDQSFATLSGLVATIVRKITN